MRKYVVAQVAVVVLGSLVVLAGPRARAQEPGATPAAPPAPSANPQPTPAVQPAGTTQQVAADAPPPAEPAPDAGASRTLAGHRFMQSAIVPQPFTTTSFGAALVAGLGNTTGNLTIGSKNYSGGFDYAGAGSTLAYEQAFLDHFAARIQLQEFIYSGIDGDSVLVVGSTVQLSGSAGVTASTQLTDNLRLAALIDVGYGPNLAITIGQGISEIIAQCQQTGQCTVNSDEVFGSTKMVTLQPAVSAGWAPFRALGVTAAAAFIYGDSSGKVQASGEALSLAGSVDYDFLAISSVPIGLQVAVNWRGSIGGEALKTITDLGGGVFYTGRKDLSLGLQVIRRRFAVTPNVDVSWGTTIAEAGLRYYW